VQVLLCPHYSQVHKKLIEKCHPPHQDSFARCLFSALPCSSACTVSSAWAHGILISAEIQMKPLMPGGFLTAPMRFANDYYASFPKVALGHYPPGYYMLAGTLLLATTSVKVFFVLQSLLLATLAAIVSRLLLKVTNAPLAIATGLSVVVSPLCLQQTQLVMSD
jgi:hypothetical protein